MKNNTLGVIGPGKHFCYKIYPILAKSKFFKISGILRKNNFKYLKNIKKNIKILSERNFFSKRFNFIYISCPNKFHEKYIIKSLKYNSHVICEKPFLIRSKNLKKILYLSSYKKKLIFESFMFLYHPVFSYVKRIIKDKRYGGLKYLIANFRFPSLNKNNHRYTDEGRGFFFDAACYMIAIENHLFNKDKFNSEYFLQKIKNKFDLRGNIFIKSNINRFYFWGEGQNYSNNLELFFNKASIFIDKFFTKKDNEVIVAKIHYKGRIFEKRFNQINHFQEMFDVVSKNYKKISFQNFHRKKIKDQLHLLLNYNKY